MKRDHHLDEDQVQSFGPVFRMVASMGSIETTWTTGDIVSLISILRDKQGTYLTSITTQ